MAILFLFIVIFVILAGIIGFFSIYFSQKLDKSAIIAQKAEIRIITTKNTLIKNNFGRYVSYKDISSPLINSFIALEDKRFFSHNGIDYYRTLGAIVHNLKAGKIKEGGSTITQQLAKNTQLTNEKTFKRKIKELRLAREIEKNYTKEQILEMYLNAIYFGNGIYGIDSACRYYFDKNPSEITVAEGALLAGIVKNPSKYSPSDNNLHAKERQKMVLSLLLEQGYITRSEYDNALLYTYTKPNNDYNSKPYLTNVLQEAASLLNISEKALIRSPYTIETYYDEEKQTLLHNSFASKHFECENGADICDYSCLLCDNKTGGVLAFYGNFDRDILSFRRSPASTIKPSLVYAPALEKNTVTESSLLCDEKINLNGYSPRNYGDIYQGNITVRDALSQSVNTVAVRLLQQNGVEYSKNIATRCGLTFHEDDIYPSLALGGMKYGVTQQELAACYMTFACQGLQKEVTFIKKITDENGKILYFHKETPSYALSPSTSYLLTDMLKYTAQVGTAKKLKDLPFEVASKTGTSTFDAWNLSYTTQNTLCVWYGSHDNTPLTTTGSGYPTLLAKHILQQCTPKENVFPQPYSITKTEIDTYALQNEQKNYLAHPSTPQKYRETFCYSLQNSPQEISPYFNLGAVRWDISVQNNEINITCSSPQKYRYKLITHKIGSDQDTVYDLSGNDFLPNTEHSLMQYKIGVYFDNELIGYTESKLLFT